MSRGPNEKSGETRANIRGGVSLVLGRGLSLVVSMATQVLVVRHLLKSDYGAFACVLSLVEVLSTLATFSMDKTVARFAALDAERGDRRRLVATLLFATGLTTVLGLLAVVGASATILTGVWQVGESPDHGLQLLLLIALVPVNALDALFLSCCNVFGGARPLLVRRFVLGPLVKLAAVACVVFTTGGLTEIAAAHVFAGLVGMLVSGGLAWRLVSKAGIDLRGAWTLGNVSLAEVLAFSAAQFGSDLVQLLYGSMVVVLLGVYGFAEGAADYRAILPLARLNQLVSIVFTVLFVPSASRLFARGQIDAMGDLYRRGRAWTALCTFPILAATVVAGGPLAVLLFGESYADARTVLALLSVGLFVQSACGSNGQALRVLDRARVVLLTDVVVLALALTASLLVVPELGAVGGAAVVAASMSLHSLWKQWLVARSNIRTFGEDFWSIQLSTVVGVLGTAALVGYWSLNLPATLFAVTAVWGVVLLVNLQHLRIEETFPEIARWSLVRRITHWRETRT